MAKRRQSAGRELSGDFYLFFFCYGFVRLIRLIHQSHSEGICCPVAVRQFRGGFFSWSVPLACVCVQFTRAFDLKLDAVALTRYSNSLHVRNV